MKQSVAVLAIAALAAAVPSSAETPRAAYAAAYGWSAVAFGGPPTDVRFGGGLEGRIPIPIRDDVSFGELAARIEIASLPDKGFSLEDLGTWGDRVEISGTYEKAIAGVSVGRQRIRSSVLALGSFASAVGDTEINRERFSRRLGAGVRFEEERSRSWLLVAFGRDQGVGPGFETLMLEASIQIRRPMRFVARAGVDLGGAPAPGELADRTDYVSAGAAVHWGSGGSK